MAFPLEQMRRASENETLFPLAIAAFRAKGVKEAIDAGFLDDGDMDQIFSDAPQLRETGESIRRRCDEMKSGWIKLDTVVSAAAVRTPDATISINAPISHKLPTESSSILRAPSSVVRLNNVMKSVTRNAIWGRPRKVRKDKSLGTKTVSLQSIKEAKMLGALKRVHAVFAEPQRSAADNPA